MTNLVQQVSQVIPPFRIGRIECHRTTVGGQGFLRVVEKCQRSKMTGGRRRLLICRLPFFGFAREYRLEDGFGRGGMALSQLGEGVFNTRWGIGLTLLLRQGRDSVRQRFHLILIGLLPLTEACKFSLMGLYERLDNCFRIQDHITGCNNRRATRLGGGRNITASRYAVFGSGNIRREAVGREFLF